MSRSKLLGAIFALPLMIAGASGAQANIIGLTIDGSSSISTTDFDLQKDGYVAALGALLQADGQNTIGVWQFSTSVQEVFALRTIVTAQDKQDLLDAIAGMIQLDDFTAIGDSIDTARTAINAFVGGSGEKIIDVSTDGENNTGADPATASATAFASGIKVNCLGVGGSADCSFNDHNPTPYGQDFLAGGFDEFEEAIKTKLSAELTGVPEPMTIALFSVGLAGAGMLRRRAKKA